MSELSGGASYLFLDDLYHIRRADQPQLVDYFYRIAKDNNLWLKMGTSASNIVVCTRRPAHWR